MRNYYRLICVLTLGLLACGCGSGNVSSTGQTTAAGDTSLPAGMQVSVLPETYTAGGTARISATSAPAPDGSIQIAVRADDAQALKALFVRLSYDATQWHPVGANASGLLATGSGLSSSDLLQLSGSVALGSIDLGQILTLPEHRSGFAGDGVLATLTLAPGLATPQRTTSAALKPFELGIVRVVSGPTRYITWDYDLPGDYDQNGEVGVSDLVPMSRHLNEAIPDGSAGNSILKVIDGDGNGEINLADLAVIGRNFGQRLKYEVYRTRQLSELPFDLSVNPPQPKASPVTAYETVGLETLQGDPAGARRTYQVPLGDNRGYYLWLRALDRNNVEQDTTQVAFKDLVFEHYWPHWDLTFDGAAHSLVHRRSIPGDTDSNGEINIADLNPLSQVLNQAGPFALNSKGYLCDLNFDNVVTTADLSVLIMHLYQEGDHFNVYATANAADVPADLFAPSTLAPVGQDHGELDNFTPASGTHVWIRPVYNNEEGPCSDPIVIP